MKNPNINFLIGGVVIVLVIVGVGYYISVSSSKPKVNEDITSPIIDQPDQKLTNDPVLTKPESKSEVTISGGEIKESEDSNKTFNEAMSKAQKAFVAKDYALAITSYDNALGLKKSDTAYAGLYTVYSAQQEWVKAIGSLDKAIELSAYNADYWIWKLLLLDEKTSSPYVELRKLYEEGMQKIDPRKQVDLTTSFARIAESNNEPTEALRYWEKAKELMPLNAKTYQSEIDRINSL